MAQNKIINDMKLTEVSELTNEKSLKEFEKTGLYPFCGFAISNYAAEIGVSGKELLGTRIVTGIISSDDKFSDEELNKLGDELEQLHPDIIVFDYWYHYRKKNNELSYENIKKVKDILIKRLALHELHSYANRLTYCRTKDRLMLIKICWNYGGEGCVVYARNARHAFNVFKTAPNHISDMLQFHHLEALENLEWTVTEEDEMHLKAASSNLFRHKIYIAISPLGIPEGRVGYSLMSYVEM